MTAPFKLKDFNIKRVKEICASMARVKGPKYAADLEASARLILMTSQIQGITEKGDDPVVDTLLTLLGVSMIATLLQITGIDQHDLKVVTKAAVYDSQDITKKVMDKLREEGEGS